MRDVDPSLSLKQRAEWTQRVSSEFLARLCRADVASLVPDRKAVSSAVRKVLSSMEADGVIAWWDPDVEVRHPDSPHLNDPARLVGSDVGGWRIGASVSSSVAELIPGDLDSRFGIGTCSLWCSAEQLHPGMEEVLGVMLP